MDRFSMPNTNNDVNVLAIVKGDEKYVFCFTDAQADNTLRTFGRFASNLDLSFSWLDAATLSKKLREVIA